MTDRPVRVVSPTEGQSFAGLGTLRCKVPSEMTVNACTVLELRLAPGQGSGLHVHQHEEEIVFVQDGSCTVGQRDQRWELETGSWVVFPKQSAHFFHNSSDSVCTLIITAIPGGLDRYFAALSAAIEKQDAEAIAAVNAEYGITFLDS